MAVALVERLHLSKSDRDPSDWTPVHVSAATLTRAVDTARALRPGEPAESWAYDASLASRLMTRADEQTRRHVLEQAATLDSTTKAEMAKAMHARAKEESTVRGSGSQTFSVDGRVSAERMGRAVRDVELAILLAQESSKQRPGASEGLMSGVAATRLAHVSEALRVAILENTSSLEVMDELDQDPARLSARERLATARGLNNHELRVALPGIEQLDKRAEFFSRDYAREGRDVSTIPDWVHDDPRRARATLEARRLSRAAPLLAGQNLSYGDGPALARELFAMAARTVGPAPVPTAPVPGTPEPGTPEPGTPQAAVGVPAPPTAPRLMEVLAAQPTLPEDLVQEIERQRGTRSALAGLLRNTGLSLTPERLRALYRLALERLDPAGPGEEPDALAERQDAEAGLLALAQRADLPDDLRAELGRLGRPGVDAALAAPRVAAAPAFAPPAPAPGTMDRRPLRL